jgi:predicted permease
MDTLRSDLRYALRRLAHDRGFAAIAVLTLALGIGANTSIFSVVNSVLIRPLAYADPQRLYVVRQVIPALSHLYPWVPVNGKHFLEWRKQCSSFDEIAVISPGDFNLTGVGTPERVGGASVSAGLFAVLGVEPRLGRAFLPQEDAPGHNQVVILADSLWRRRYGADPALVGKTIAVDGSPHVVVGILPSSFRFQGAPAPQGYFRTLATRTEVFKPLALNPADLDLEGDFDYGAVARVKAGVSPQRAEAELNVVEARLVAQTKDRTEVHALMSPLQEELVAQSRAGLLVLWAAVGAVLLIVCVNLGNLLLTRATGRTREIAIRAALGATRWRLVRQVLTESLLLSLAGGSWGTVLAVVAVRVFVNRAPIGLPRLDEVHVDWRLFGFALAVSVVTALLFGSLPAWKLTRADPYGSLKSASRTTTEGMRRVQLREILVAFEVGLSAVLLIVAGLLMNSFLKLINVDKGFETQRVLAVDVSLPSPRYQDHQKRIQFYQQVLARLKALPGVRSAGLVSRLPLAGEAWVDVISLPGDHRPVMERPMAPYRFVSPDYFQTVGIPLRQGRELNESDRNTHAVLVSERTARRVWPGQNPIGKQFRRGDESKPPQEVVGVVGDIRGSSLQEEPTLMVYVPYWSEPRNEASFTIRTAMDPHSLGASVRRAVWSVDPDMPISDLQTLEEITADSVAPRRFQMLLTALFAGAALLLASLGIYGVVSYSVARRTNELGIRMTLGAKPADLLRMVLRQGLRPVGLGLIAGVAAALSLGRVVGSLLFGVKASDPLTYGAVVILLGAVAVSACWIPGRRAARTIPMEALRCE